jgi:hypothetical protein
VVYVLEVCLAFEVGHVLKGASPEIIHTHYVVAFREEPLAEVAPKESSTPVTSARFFATGRASRPGRNLGEGYPRP